MNIIVTDERELKTSTDGQRLSDGYFKVSDENGIVLAEALDWMEHSYSGSLLASFVKTLVARQALTIIKGSIKDL